jgi:exodeoxyribonuclease V beta subunit
MKTLNLLQEPRKGINFIEANAGTGKTFSISHIYLWLILKGIKVENILVVTFTDAAAKELKDRCRSLIYDALIHFDDDTAGKPSEIVKVLVDSGEDAEMLNRRLKLAVASMDIASIFTIHGFCNKMLSEFAVETGVLFDATLVDDDSSYVEQTVINYYRKLFYEADADTVELLSSCVSYKSLCDFAGELKKNHELCIEGEDKNSLQGSREALMATGLRLQESIIKEFQQLEVEYERSKSEARDVLTKLIDEGKLNKSTYSPQKLDGIFEQFEEILKDPLRLTKLSAKKKEEELKSIKKLSMSFIIDRLNKKYKDEQIECAFFCFVDSFLGRYALLDEQYTKAYDSLKIQILIDFRLFFLNNFAALKRNQNIISYDDMLELMHNALYSNAGDDLADKIAKLYGAALIDEFQDTDKLQFEIFSKIFKRSEKYFYMIGDPKQSIYKFRGADIQMYMSAKKEADFLFTLETNYRSEPGIINDVNKFFDVKLSNNRNSLYYVEENSYIQFLPSKGQDKVKWRFYSPDQSFLNIIAIDKSSNKTNLEEMVARDVAHKIFMLLTCDDYCFESQSGERRSVAAQDIAVLVNTGKQALLIKSVLQELKIAASVQKSGNVFESKEADAMALLLNAINSPGERTIKPLLITSLFNYSIKELRELDNRAVLDLYYRFITYKQIWEEQGFYSAFLALVNDFDLIARILRGSNGDRNVANTIHLVELIHRQEYLFKTSSKVTERWFVMQKKSASDNDGSEVFLQRLEIDEEAVSIMTVHKSKGLEFPLVFAPFICGSAIRTKSYPGVYTDDKNVFRKIYTEDSKANPKYIEETLQESLRLIYVALTRAANRCWTYYYEPTRTNPEHSPFRVLYSDVQSLKDQGLSVEEYDDLENVSDNYRSFELNQGEPCELKSAEFKRLDVSKLKSGIFSYSMLADWKKSALIVKDIDSQEDTQESKTAVAAEDDYSFFYFPRGANTGTAIHQVFEYIFKGKLSMENSQSFEAGLINCLKAYGVYGNDEEVRLQRVAAALEMIENVMNAKFNVGDDSFMLKDLNINKCKTELEFFYSLFFGTHREAPQSIKAMGGNIEFLSQLDLSGYMTGFIDLVFEYKGKFYILDWKTNHLGNSFELYSPNVLKDEMQHAKYDIQYVVYTYALNSYLKQRLGDEYSYDKHFGGVFYTFVRGMQAGTTNGIFFDKVEKDIIEWLNFR